MTHDFKAALAWHCLLDYTRTPEAQAERDERARKLEAAFGPDDPEAVKARADAELHRELAANHWATRAALEMAISQQESAR
jgi:hypothetical protein